MELSNPGLIWLSIGVILFVLEMAVPGFVLFFFGLAAWITALGCYLFPWSLNTQLAVFLVSSLVSLFTLRTIVKKVFLGDAKDDDADSIMANGGEKCVVSAAINPPAKGQVKFSGTFWRAEAEENIEEGEVVEIVEQKDLLITVKKIR
ncbi:MAG TPA: NfeD family protein [Desulfocapsa sulfexigens]|nr:NfeD family protein [Desulfocapsa sulfexigens]